MNIFGYLIIALFVFDVVTSIILDARDRRIQKMREKFDPRYLEIESLIEMGEER